MGIPNELVLPVNADHQSMCRFANSSSQGYLLIENAILGMIATAGQPLETVSNQQVSNENPVGSGSSSPTGTLSEEVPLDPKSQQNLSTPSSSSAASLLSDAISSPGLPHSRGTSISPTSLSLSVSLPASSGRLESSEGTFERFHRPNLKLNRDTAAGRKQVPVSRSASSISLVITGLRKKQVTDDPMRQANRIQIELPHTQSLAQLEDYVEGKGKSLRNAEGDTY